MNKPIAIDIDDVIADLSTDLHLSLAKRYDFVTPVSTWSSYSYTVDLGVPYDDFLQHIIDDNLLKNLRPIPGAAEALRGLKKAGADLVMITSRGYHPDAYSITEEWLVRNEMTFDDLIIVPHGETKSQAAKLYYPKGFQLMADDYAKNLKDMRAAGLLGRAVLIDMPWNRSQSEYRMNSSRFHSLIDMVEEMQKEVRHSAERTIQYGIAN